MEAINKYQEDVRNIGVYYVRKPYTSKQHTITFDMRHIPLRDGVYMIERIVVV